MAVLVLISLFSYKFRNNVYLTRAQPGSPTLLGFFYDYIFFVIKSFLPIYFFILNLNQVKSKEEKNTTKTK